MSVSGTTACHHERPHLPRHLRCLFHRQRTLRALLRQPLIYHTMETVIVGLIALGLFAYLFVAMIKPEKF